MNKNTVRLTLVLAIGCACATWSPAQEEDVPAKKPAPRPPSASKIKAQEQKNAAKAKAAAEARARAVDINHASRDVLKKVPGMTDALANSIIANRPYKSKAELVTKNAIPLDYYQTIRKLVAAK